MVVYSKTMGGAGRRAKRGRIQTSRAGEGEGARAQYKAVVNGCVATRSEAAQPTAHARLGGVRLIGWCRPLAGPRRLRLARSSLIRRDASQCGRSLRSHLRVPMRALATDGGAARLPPTFAARWTDGQDSSRWRGFAAREPSERDFASICLVAERDTADATPRAARDGGKTARTTRGERETARRDRPTVGSRCHFCFVHTLLFCLYCGTRLTSAKHGGKKLVKDGCTYARANGLVGIVRTGGMRQLGGYLGQCEAYDLFRWAGGLEFDVGGRSGRLAGADAKRSFPSRAMYPHFARAASRVRHVASWPNIILGAQKKTNGGRLSGRHHQQHIATVACAHGAARLEITNSAGRRTIRVWAGGGTQRWKHRDGFVTATRRTRGDEGRAVACPCSA